MMGAGTGVRKDAWSKVTGKALYVADLAFPGMLTMRVARVLRPSARLERVDTAGARLVPGVVGVYTAQDIPGSWPAHEKPVLAGARVLSYGDPVAAVAAQTDEAARAGVAQIRIQYTETEPVLTPAAALAPGCPPLHGQGNCILRHHVRKGDAETAFQDAAVVLERTYTTSCTMPGAIEPEGVVVRPEGGVLTVYCPCKAPFNIRRIVAAACALPMSRVRVVQAVVGGSFGGKDDDTGAMAARAALAALDTGRPCRMVWDREESVLEGVKRHPFQLHWKIGADAAGHIRAAQVRGYVDGGAYLSKTKTTCFRGGIEATGPYEIGHVDVLLEAAYTNKCYAGAVRGFGSPQVDFASETLLDELAEALGLTPWQIRERNLVREGSLSGSGQPLANVRAAECLAALKRAFGEDLRPFVRKGKLVGRGIACLYRGESYGAGTPVADVSGAVVTVNADGSVCASTGLSEVGQGGHTMLARVIEKALGVEAGQVEIAPVDTAYCVDSGATAASRGTVTGGNAMYRAAAQVGARIRAALGAAWGCEAGAVVLRGGRAQGPGHDIPFGEAAALCHKSGVDLRGVGWWKAPPTHWDPEQGSGSNYMSYAYGACGAEAEVDPITGKVDVVDFVAVHDLGEALDEGAVRGQVAGGVSMGLGYALLENVTWREGRMQTQGLSDYLMPTALDMCRVRTVILENKGGVLPLRAHGIGEPATAIVAPAVLNAVSAALGVRIRDLPADLETIRRCLDEREASR